MVKDITIVSLSRGLLGEPFVKHELEIGLKRLKEYGLNVHFSKHALSGIKFISEHPELRASDLIDALHSDTDMILCAIGGDDTYRLLPFLFDNDELKNAASDKIFLGFSDTTMNHFMFNKIGMKTFYGESFLSDVCEIAPQMLPYTKHFFEELIRTGRISEIEPSDIWYDARQDFSSSAVGTTMNFHKNTGFELLQGPSAFSGKILGGCIDSIFDIFDGGRYPDSPVLCSRYGLFPDAQDWKDKILLLETSEEMPDPEKYMKMIIALKNTGIFNKISGILMGKPVDEKYSDDYKKIIVDVVADGNLPIVANINIGHATPRCIIPFGVMAHVNVEKQIIDFEWNE